MRHNDKRKFTEHLVGKAYDPVNIGNIKVLLQK
jgi:hypothetical protein